MDVPFVQFVQQIKQAPSSALSGWLSILAPSIVAVLVTWLAHHYAARREAKKMKHDAKEANRVEYLRSRIAALQDCAEAVVAMESEYEALTHAAFSGSWEQWNTASETWPAYAKATALQALYFWGDFLPEFGDYTGAYMKGRGAAMDVAHARQRLLNPRLAPDKTRDELQQEYEAAVDAVRPMTAKLYAPFVPLIKKMRDRLTELSEEG